MAVTNVKSTWLAKLLGQTNDKKNLPEEGMPMANPAAGANPGLRFQNQTPLFGPEGLGSTPQAAAPAPAQRSRYNLFEMTQPQPTRDTESEEMIKRRAKVNAFGVGISGLAGLASMATGGDVPQPVDLQTPWNMDQSLMLDQDYRGRLQNWIDQGFQVDQANTQLQNRGIEQDIDAENSMEQIRLRGEEARQLAEQRAQYALQQLQAKSQTEQMQEMMRMGIDPNQADAYEKYLQANRSKFATDLNYTKARTNWNNRISSGAGKPSVGSGSGKDMEYPLATLKKGRDAKISRLESQKSQALKSASTTPEKQQIEKYYNDLIAEERKYKPGANPLIDAEIAELGYQIEEQEMGGTRADGMKKMPGSNEYYDPEKMPLADDYMDWVAPSDQNSAQANEPIQPKMPKVDMNLPPERRQSILQEMGNKVSVNAAKLGGESPDLELAEQIAQEWVDAGLYDDIEDAWNMVFLLAQEANNR